MRRIYRACALETDIGDLIFRDVPLPNKPDGIDVAQWVMLGFHFSPEFLSNVSSPLCARAIDP